MNEPGETYTLYTVSAFPAFLDRITATIYTVRRDSKICKTSWVHPRSTWKDGVDMKSRTHTNSGSALVYVLVIMVVVTLLGIVLLNLGVFETRMSVREQKKMEAYYLAKTGVKTTAEYLMDPAHAGSVQDYIDAGTSSSNPVSLGNGTFEVTVSNYPPMADKIERIRIESTGTVPYQSGTVERTESLLIEKIFLFSKAVFASGNLHNATNSRIDGEVEVGGTIDNPGTPYITEQPPIEHSTRRYPDPVMPNTLAFEDAFGSDETEFPGTYPTDEHMPPNGTLDVNTDLTIYDNDNAVYAAGNQYGNRHYSTMSINSAKKLTFDISKDMRIYVDSFTANNAKIEVKSSTTSQGALFVYVRDYFSFHGDITSPPETFYLISDMDSTADSSKKIVMQTGTQTFNGYIYAPKANLEYKSGSYTGALICGEGTLSSGGTVSYVGTGISKMLPEALGLDSFGYKMGLWGK